MGKDIYKLIKCHLRALCGKCKAESGRDSIMLAKKVDCSLTLHKRFTPDKAICSINVKTDELTVSLKALGLFIVSAICAVSAVSALRRVCFNLKWKRRF
ncbi:MAG: hypothetical protein WCQ72_05765 [Eubacteriales bacterium]